LLPILVLCALSCARDDESKDEPAAESEPRAKQRIQREAGEVVSKREITLTEAAPAEKAQPAAAPQSEQQRLLSLESSQVLPQDFEIGPLADLVGIDRSRQEMVSVTTRFLDALQEGSVPVESLHNSVREELASSISYYLKKDLIPVTYRIGAITTESQGGGDQNSSALQRRTAWMNIRLFGSPGVCEGELYLEKSGGRWYVSDLQINFEMLEQSYSREQERYYPSAYGWGIQ
jgi:hypothetical protein